MDLVLAVAVWAVGAWIAYRVLEAPGEPPAHTRLEPPRFGGSRPGDPRERPRHRQEGMDVRRRRGRCPL